jgi:hypothetical protein
MLRLKGFYDSSSFLPNFIIDCCSGIRNKDITEIPFIFDKVVIDRLEEYGSIPANSIKTISDLFSTFSYKNLIHQNKNLSKYILLRVDETLSKLMSRASLITDSTIDLENLFNRTNRKSYELHLEHMYANNERNEVLFKNEVGEFDYYLFDQQRNKFGALLLLKDLHNLSSGADVYEDKTVIYGQSNIIWNEILVGEVPEIDLKKLPFKLTVFEPNEDGLLDLSAIDQRQKELFEIIKYTWSNDL